MGKNWLLYDCEIIKGIPSRDSSEMLEDIKYCAGWDDHKNMGISVICAYDFADGRYHVFLEDNLGEFASLARASDEIIGFNSRKFDDNLCRANGIEISTTYDLLEEARIAAGFGADYTSVPPGYSYKLDSLALATLERGKSGSGALAPVLWQRGERGAVVNYCLNDVQITKQLLELAWQGQLRDPNTDSWLTLPLPGEEAEPVGALADDEIDLD